MRGRTPERSKLDCGDASRRVSASASTRISPAPTSGRSRDRSSRMRSGGVCSGAHGWDLLMLRNEWFQSEAAAILPRSAGRPNDAVRPQLLGGRRFSSRASGAAGPPCSGRSIPGRNITSRSSDWPADRPEFGPPPAAPPAVTLTSGGSECELADWIVVNSDWSRESLIRAGVPERKLRTIALPYQRDAAHAFDTRVSGRVFDRAAVARAVRRHRVGREGRRRSARTRSIACEDAPIELQHGRRSRDGRSRSFLRRIRASSGLGRRSRDGDGSLPRQRLLVFPSHSDGFGMAQIEAQGWGAADRRVAKLRARGSRRRNGHRCCAKCRPPPSPRRCAARLSAAADARASSRARQRRHARPASTALAAGLVGAGRRMTPDAVIDPWFLEHLVCPRDHQRADAGATARCVRERPPLSDCRRRAGDAA